MRGQQMKHRLGAELCMGGQFDDLRVIRPAST